MTFIGFHASQEQLPPSQLLRAVEDAEAAGFDGAFSADHLAPWTPSQGESGNTLTWLGAALARTQFGFGAVATPGYRYHPVVMAHAIATLGEMFPGRYFAALGSGELLNEHVIGGDWPEKAERTARLGECVDVIRRLLAGEEVTHSGRVEVHRARLWSLPEVVPELWATATSSETAAWAAGWADGLVTVGVTAEQVRKVLEAYRGAGGRGGAALQVHFALAPDDDAAMDLVRDQWVNSVVAPPERWDVAQPEDFERLAGHPDDEALRKEVLVETDVEQLAERIAGLARVGFDRVYLHEISQDQSSYLRATAPRLVAALRERTGEAA